MQVKRDITGGIMSAGVIMTSIFAILHSNLTEVNMNEVTIVENGERNTFTTEAHTVLDLMSNGYINIGNFDDVSVDLNDEIYDGMEIEIDRAIPLVINDGGERFHVMTTANAVNDVLDEHNIELGNDDLLEVVATITTTQGEEIQINPTVLTAGLADKEVEVEVTRVVFEETVETEETVLETEYIYTDELPKGEKVIRTEGSPKVEETVIEKEFRNGEYFMTIGKTTTVVDEGSPKVVAIGTYVPAPVVVTPPPAATPAASPAVSNDTSSGALSTFTANVTAYYATCPGCSGVTANGTNVLNSVFFEDATFGTVRIIAADAAYPFGTIINIAGVGNAIVLDRGGVVHGNVIDLLVDSGALQFGRQSLQAQVLRLGW